MARLRWEAQIKELEGKLQRAREEVEKVKQAKEAAERAGREEGAKF